MQKLMIDLNREPEIAAFIKDKQPGDRLTMYGTIGSLDDQTLVVSLEEVDEAEASDAEDMDAMIDDVEGDIDAEEG